MMLGELLVALERIVRWCVIVWGGSLLGAVAYLLTSGA